MRASIRQVAERAQVSRMTVTRVLRGRKEQVNPETYERVLEAVRELNYVPVRSAVQNHQVETNTISLVPYYRNPSRSAVDNVTFQGLCDKASQEGYDIFVMLRGEAEWMANREEMRFLDRRSDGFVFISAGIGEWQAALETLVEHKIPAVVCYRRDVPEGIAWVDPDNEGLIDLAMDNLIQQGHSRILYLRGPKSSIQDRELLPNLSGERSNFDDGERKRHFLKRLSALGHAEPEQFVLRINRPDWRLTEEDYQAIFARHATAVICGDAFALQLWDKLESLGKKVPGDLSIVSVDDQIEARYRGLTAVGFGYEAVGRAAMEAWLELNAGQPAEECCKIVPAQIAQRKSVGAPNSE